MIVNFFRRPDKDRVVERVFGCSWGGIVFGMIECREKFSISIKTRDVGLVILGKMFDFSSGREIMMCDNPLTGKGMYTNPLANMTSVFVVLVIELAAHPRSAIHSSNKNPNS